MDKRTFLKNAGLMGLAAPLGFAHLQSAVAAVDGIDPRSVAADEEFWRIGIRSTWDEWFWTAAIAKHP